MPGIISSSIKVAHQTSHLNKRQYGLDVTPAFKQKCKNRYDNPGFLEDVHNNYAPLLSFMQGLMWQGHTAYEKISQVKRNKTMRTISVDEPPSGRSGIN